jgi:hypothetical protein
MNVLDTSCPTLPIQGANHERKMKFLGPPSSGSIAGTTSSHNRAGQYTRNRRSPVQPIGTGRRAAVRSFFGQASTAWAGLTPANQAAWIAWANAHPITDSLGQSITKTGHQAFVGVCASLLNCGSAAPSIPPVSAVVVAPICTVFTVTHLGVITVTLTASGGASDFILMAFSAPQSPGITFCKTFWQQTHLPGTSIGGATYGTAYVAQFGTIPVGSKVFMQLTPVNQYGVTGTPVILTAVVT